jgi:hypothetical protein
MEGERGKGVEVEVGRSVQGMKRKRNKMVKSLLALVEYPEVLSRNRKSASWFRVQGVAKIMQVEL